MLAETVQVAAGSSNTIKFVYDSTLKRQDGAQIEETTCWQRVSGVAIKCETRIKQAAAGTSDNVNRKLIACRVQATGRRHETPTRFAGPWKPLGAFGFEARACVINVNADGAISGRYDSVNWECRTFVVTGNVSAGRVVNFTVQSDVQPPSGQFTARVDDALHMQGTANTAYGVEKWLMTRY